MMLTQAQRTHFETEGYLILPGVLTAPTVRALRATLRPFFDRSADARFPGDAYGDDRNQNFRLYDIWQRYPDLRWLLSHPPVLGALQALLGSDCLELPESSVALNSFGGWHKDTTTLESTGSRIHYADDFLMIGVAYYLQDNTAEYGGGLDVQPGTHRQPGDWYLHPPRPSLWQRAWRKGWRLLGRPRAPVDLRRARSVSLPLRAGDALIFNARLNHQATMPRMQPVPPEHEKLAVFDTFIRRGPHVRTYLDFIHGPAGWGYLEHCTPRAEFVQAARAAGVGLALEGYAPRSGSASR
jgi:ectoine hydroxylase-related dioxygenase (phytanoyl-CoA dioxygenase family)